MSASTDPRRSHSCASESTDQPCVNECRVNELCMTRSCHLSVVTHQYCPSLLHALQWSLSNAEWHSAISAFSKVEFQQVNLDSDSALPTR